MSNNSRDPLGLTLPPPDISQKWNIVPGHTPNDAIEWDTHESAWKICFTVYRSKIFGDTDKVIAGMLQHNPAGGDIALKRHRIYYVNHNGTNCWQYLKFTQPYVDQWVDIARKELATIYRGNDEYALYLLPE